MRLQNRRNKLVQEDLALLRRELVSFFIELANRCRWPLPFSSYAALQSYLLSLPLYILLTMLRTRLRLQLTELESASEDKKHLSKFKKMVSNSTFANTEVPLAVTFSVCVCF